MDNVHAGQIYCVYIVFVSPRNEMLEPRQSTRNNSIVENLMIEDVTVTDLTLKKTLCNILVTIVCLSQQTNPAS